MNKQKDKVALPNEASLSDTDLDKVAGGFVATEHGASATSVTHREPGVKREQKDSGHPEMP